MTATYLINKLPSLLLQWKTPYYRLYGVNADYSCIKSFGCLCFASTDINHRSKFQPCATSCIFVGYPQGMKGYKLYDIEGKKFFVSCDVVFHESIFPFHTITSASEVEDLFPNIVLPQPTGILLNYDFTASQPLDVVLCEPHSKNIDTKTSNNSSVHDSLPLSRVDANNIDVPSTFPNSDISDQLTNTSDIASTSSQPTNLQVLPLFQVTSKTTSVVFLFNNPFVLKTQNSLYNSSSHMQHCLQITRISLSAYQPILNLIIIKKHQFTHIGNKLWTLNYKQ